MHDRPTDPWPDGGHGTGVLSGCPGGRNAGHAWAAGGRYQETRSFPEVALLMHDPQRTC